MAIFIMKMVTFITAMHAWYISDPLLMLHRTIIQISSHAVVSWILIFSRMQSVRLT